MYMMSPERAIKMLLPKRLPWIIEVVDVVYEGTVKSYRGAGTFTSPSAEWEEYVVGIVIDKELVEKESKISSIDGLVLTNANYLDDYMKRHKIIELNNVLYEINQLMDIKAKYAIEIFDESPNTV